MLTGLILTNTHRLASVLCTAQEVVIEAISSYISACATYINWHMIDISDDIYFAMDKSDWLTYSSALNDYYIGLGLNGRNYCPLFILGGNEVVPMPAIENPSGKCGGEYLDSDMAYCFNLTATGFTLEDFVVQKPRFAVGRLPLSRDWGVEGLSAYLKDCVDMAANGMEIRGAAITTTQSWLRASAEMIRDIPIVALSEDYVPLNNRMIVSPDLNTEYQEWYDGYVHELKKIDFLICNLHGASEKDEPFFTGEDLSLQSHPTATQPSMMRESAPCIFNTVACFGGRYINYELEESMMMSALMYGTMLYCGSCDIAIGGVEGVEGYSEVMMKLYNTYLHQGIPAGLALIKAKQDYYRTCYRAEYDCDALYTILEFNLFGCPILWMHPKIEATYKPTLLGMPVDEHSRAQYRPKTIEVIESSAYAANDIHAYLRGLVDNNLAMIRRKVETEVYQRLGLGRDTLQQVLRVSQDHREIGYQFIYEWSAHQSYRRFRTWFFVDTDTKGNITRITQTK